MKKETPGGLGNISKDTVPKKSETIYIVWQNSKRRENAISEIKCMKNNNGKKMNGIFSDSDYLWNALPFLSFFTSLCLLHFISCLDQNIYLPLVGQSSEENLAHTFIYTQDMHH